MANQSMEDRSSEQSGIGLQIVSGFWRPTEYLMFVDGRTVRTTSGPDRWFSSRDSHQWEWLDARTWRLEAGDWFSATTLSVNGELLYEMAGLPLHLGLSWSAAIRTKRFQLEWRRVADDARVLAVDMVRTGGWFEYAFRNAQDDQIGFFEQRDRWRCRDGKRGAMPLHGFCESSDEELLLAWAFIVRSQSPSRG